MRKMVQTIMDYINNRTEGVVMVHNIDSEDTNTGIELLKEIYFNQCSVIADSEAIELNFDNDEVIEIRIDDICDVSIIFGELIIILEDLTRITITF